MASSVTAAGAAHDLNMLAAHSWRVPTEISAAAANRTDTAHSARASQQEPLRGYGPRDCKTFLRQCYGMLADRRCASDADLGGQPADFRAPDAAIDGFGGGFLEAPNVMVVLRSLGVTLALAGTALVSLWY